MDGPSPTEAILNWVANAVRAASDRTVSEENVWALVGRSIDAAGTWRIAREGYLAVLENFGGVRDGVVMKLIVPLRPADELVIDPPGDVDLIDEIDPGVPPSFVVHELVPRRDWELVEEYRRPLTIEPYFPTDPEAIQGLYIVFRTGWEIDADAPYRRQLLFEHVCGGSA